MRLKTHGWVAGLISGLMTAAAWGHPGHETTNAPALTEAAALVFIDFHNPECREVNALLGQLAEAKHLKLQRIFKHAPAHPDAMPAHEAALSAGAQGKFGPMHDVLFQQPKPAGSSLVKAAKTLGLDAAAFETAMDERQFRNAVLRDIGEARALGVTATPVIFINGTRLDGADALRTVLRQALIPPPPAWETLPVENPVLDLAGSPATGPEDAPITLIEFTDFRCGFCRMYSQVLDQLMALHPGLIRRVFKHYPLKVEGPGLLPHLVSMEALQQGNFWGMHRMLMEQPLDEVKPDIEDRARALGMNPASFAGAQSDAALRSLIHRDQEEGVRLGIRATPTTFLNGRRLMGSMNLAGMNTYVQAILASKGVASSAQGTALLVIPPGAALPAPPAGADSSACERELSLGETPASATPGAAGR